MNEEDLKKLVELFMNRSDSDVETSEYEYIAGALEHWSKELDSGPEYKEYHEFVSFKRSIEMSLRYIQYDQDLKDYMGIVRVSDPIPDIVVSEIKCYQYSKSQKKSAKQDLTRIKINKLIPGRWTNDEKIPAKIGVSIQHQVNSRTMTRTIRFGVPDGLVWNSSQAHRVADTWEWLKSCIVEVWDKVQSEKNDFIAEGIERKKQKELKRKSEASWFNVLENKGLDRWSNKSSSIDVWDPGSEYRIHLQGKDKDSDKIFAKIVSALTDEPYEDILKEFKLGLID